MSLDRDELARTSVELHANFARTGLTREQVASDLGLTPAELDDTLALEPAGPARGWLLRDYLLQVLEDQGRAPVPFTVLTNANKDRARLWFHLREAPRHTFTA